MKTANLKRTLLCCGVAGVLFSTAYTFVGGFKSESPLSWVGYGIFWAGCLAIGDLVTHHGMRALKPTPPKTDEIDAYTTARVEMELERRAYGLDKSSAPMATGITFPTAR